METAELKVNRLNSDLSVIPIWRYSLKLAGKGTAFQSFVHLLHNQCLNLRAIEMPPTLGYSMPCIWLHSFVSMNITSTKFNGQNNDFSPRIKTQTGRRLKLTTLDKFHLDAADESIDTMTQVHRYLTKNYLHTYLPTRYIQKVTRWIKRRSVITSVIY